MGDQENKNDFIQVMGEALSEVQVQILKAIELVYANEYPKAIEVLSRASATCELEPVQLPETQIEQGASVWVNLPPSIHAGRFAGIFNGMHHNGSDLICTLIAGPKKFNQQVIAKNHWVKPRKEQR